MSLRSSRLRIPHSMGLSPHPVYINSAMVLLQLHWQHDNIIYAKQTAEQRELTALVAVYLYYDYSSLVGGLPKKEVCRFDSYRK